MTASLHGYDRYAVYYAPPAGSALARLGAAWLGWDPDAGAEAGPLEIDGLPETRARLVREARRYGLHATFKAPFRLAEGIGVEILDAAVAALAARLPPAAGPALAVAIDLGFICLRPGGPAPAVDALAAACVTELDLLRAPLTSAELFRRRRAGLDMVEDAHLRTWGYPYVLDRFSFHITLTGPLAKAEARLAAPLFAEAFAGALDGPFAIGELCLFGDPGERGPFRLLRRYPLGG
jgi:hypothetical protein